MGNVYPPGNPPHGAVFIDEPNFEAVGNWVCGAGWSIDTGTGQATQDTEYPGWLTQTLLNPVKEGHQYEGDIYIVTSGFYVDVKVGDGYTDSLYGTGLQHFYCNAGPDEKIYIRGHPAGQPYVISFVSLWETGAAENRVYQVCDEFYLMPYGTRYYEVITDSDAKDVVRVCCTEDRSNCLVKFEP